MATGAGKTTVMAMIIAWQTLNAVRMPGSDCFSRAFLVVTPGITIKDRLQVLYPEHPESYYRSRELLPNDMLGDIGKAAIVITNYHSFQHRETMALSRVGRAFLTGNDPEPVETRETDGEMLDRACGKLLSFKNVVVINDEAHHCYRQRALSEEERLDREAQAEARENNEAARLWISGIEALKRKIGRARRLRSVGDAVFPAWLGLSRGNPVSLGRLRFQPDGCDRVRHRQIAAHPGRG